MISYITVPQLNPNEDSVLLSAIVKPTGSPVRKGEVIAEIETEKANVELEAETAGYIHFFAREGDLAAVGSVLAAISESLEEVVAPPVIEESTAQAGAARLTKKAELQAKKLGISISDLTLSLAAQDTITEADVLKFASSAGTSTSVESAHDLVDDIYPETRQQRLLLIGGGLGAVQVLDALTRIQHQRATAIVDDNLSMLGKTLMGVPVLGSSQDIERLFGENLFDACIVSVSTSRDFRERMADLAAKMSIPMANVIDSTARVQANAKLGAGNVILAFCQIGSCAALGDGNFLSAYVDIEHHCTIGNYCAFGPGVMMSSLVNIGDKVKFGTGIFIEPKVRIGRESVISSGAIITNHIPERSAVKTRMNYMIKKLSD